MRKEVKVETAIKSRICYTCAGTIPKGEACIVFRAYQTSANLCRVCIIDMQEQIYQANVGYIIRKGIK